MKSIFGFTDYRAFLKAYYEFAKKGATGFSYERFSKLAGIKSANYLKLIIDGDKNLSPGMILRFARALTLSFPETQYFEAMVRLDQAEDEAEKKYYGQRLRELKRGRHPTSARLNEKSVLAAWFYPAILVSAPGLSKTEAPRRIGELTGIPQAKIIPALGALTKAGLLDARGETYALPEKHLYLGGRATASAQRKAFLGDQLALSRRAFEKLYDENRGRFFSHTFTIHSEDYDLVMEKVSALLEQLTAQADEKSSNRVMQINAQAFCLQADLA